VLLLVAVAVPFFGQHHRGMTVCCCCFTAGSLGAQGYGNQRFVFQGVHETICYGPSDKPWAENESRINQIVFIGRKLDRKALMEGFR
jgi:hypothetical protein